MANIIQINGYTISSSNSGGGGSDFPYTGSAIISGSLVITGSTTSTLGFTGSLFGTSSWATNALTASLASTASRLNADNTSIFGGGNRMTITASNGIIINAGNIGVDIESKISVAGQTTITGDLLPGQPITDNTSSWSLGSPTAAWKDLYVSNGSVNFISGSNTASISFTNGNIDFGSANVSLPVLTTASQQYIVTYNSESGQLFYTASSAISSGGSTVSTASLLTTASVSLNTITFTKGDGSTFPITVTTGSAGGPTTVVLSSDFTPSTTGWTDVTGLSFSMTSGKTYKWRATLVVVATSGNGQFSTDGPTGTTTYRFTTGTGGTTNNVNNGIANNAGATFTMSSANRISTADGIYSATNSGTFYIALNNSISSAVTVKAGSVLEWEEVL